MIESELDSYLRTNYGSCTRGSECYWGKTKGSNRATGCLKIGWKGRACEHWRPISDELLKVLKANGYGPKSNAS